MNSRLESHFLIFGACYAGKKVETVSSSVDEPPDPAFGNLFEPSPHSSLAGFQSETAGSSQEKTFQIHHAVEAAQVIQRRTSMHNFEYCIKFYRLSLIIFLPISDIRQGCRKW